MGSVLLHRKRHESMGIVIRADWECGELREVKVLTEISSVNCIQEN